VTCAGCNNIETHPVTLVTGRVVCSSCEEWRHECQAKSIAALPTLNERRAYLDSIQDRHGLPARQALETTIRLLWQNR